MSLTRPISQPAAEALSSHLHLIDQPSRIRLVDELERAGEQTVGALARTLDQSL